LEGFRPLVRVILATIRADATVAAEIDYFCDSTVFALVGKEATTLVLAGQHLVDFFDFDHRGGYLFPQGEMPPN